MIGRRGVLLLLGLAAFTAGCSQARPRDGEGPWIAEAARRHAVADERLAAGDRPAARSELLAIIDAPVPANTPEEDSRGILQDTCFRLAKLDLEMRNPRAPRADCNFSSRD